MSHARLLVCTMFVTLAASAGCQQRVYMTKSTVDAYKQLAMNLPETAVPAADFTPHVTEIPIPSTVNKPEGEKRPISLAECIAIALENGRTGQLFPQGNGDTRAFGLQGNGRPGNTSDAIRVFAFDPAIQATTIEQSLSKFDARIEASMAWNKVDRPIGTALDTFQSFGAGVFAIEQDQAQFRANLLKPLPTGGLAGITFRTDYEFSNLEPRVNPSYRPTLEFAIEQPLLQGAGVFINQLRTQHPGGIRQAINPGVSNRVEGILITRLFYNQTEMEFNRQVQQLLFAVEQAYWELYSAYWLLYSREAGLRVTHEAWQVIKINLDVGKVSEIELAALEEQYHQFRLQRLQALGNGAPGRPGVLEAERRLRYVMGLPAEDGKRLIPLDSPTVAPHRPDWHKAVAEAMAHRPELVQTRLDVQAAQLALLRDKDLLLPDVRAFASYDFTAIGSHLDGRDDLSALRNLTQTDFNNWVLGLRSEWILGFRGEHAQAQRAQLELAQRLVYLRDQEQKIAYALQRSFRDLVQYHREIEIQRARRLANENELKLRIQQIEAGKKIVGDLEWRDVVNRWANSLADEQLAIANYNIALAEFELQKGTILQHDNVQIIEGPMPSCAVSRASEHIRERDRACVFVPHGCEDCSGDPTAGGWESLLPAPAAPETGILPRLFGGKHGRAVKALPPILRDPESDARGSHDERREIAPILPASGREPPRQLLPPNPQQ